MCHFIMTRGNLILNNTQKFPGLGDNQNSCRQAVSIFLYLFLRFFTWDGGIVVYVMVVLHYIIFQVIQVL